MHLAQEPLPFSLPLPLMPTADVRRELGPSADVRREPGPFVSISRMMEIINYWIVVLHHCLRERVVSPPGCQTLKEGVVIRYDWAPGTVLPVTPGLVPLQTPLLCVCRQLHSRVSHPAGCPLVWPTSKANPQSLWGRVLPDQHEAKPAAAWVGFKMLTNIPTDGKKATDLCGFQAQPWGFLLRPPSYPTRHCCQGTSDASLQLLLFPPDNGLPYPTNSFN